MALIDGMLRELEEEAVTTRRVLERVPIAPVVLFLLSGFVVWGRRKDLFAE
jgi:hypothetical protein